MSTSAIPTLQLFNHGKIFTSSEIIKLTDAENGNLPKGSFAESILVRDGKVIAIGDTKTTEDAARSIEVSTIDRINLEGKLVVPGFIDGHAHVTMMGSALDRIDLINCHSVSDIQHTLKEAYSTTFKNNKPKRILCKNWKQTSTGESVTAKDIDSIISDIPVYIEASSLHSSWLNSAALKELEIEDDTPNPDGGEILRNKEGKATGVMSEMAHFKIVWPGWARLKTDKEGEDEVLRALNEYSANGYTGTTDMAMDEAMLNNIKRLQNRLGGTLPLRISAYWYIFPDPDIEKSLDQVRLAANLKQENDDWVRVIGIKVMVDGIVDVCTASLKKPYFDGSQCGPIWPLETLKKVTSLADQLGLQIAMHAIGDEAVHVAIEAVAALPGDPSKVDRRTRIEHLEVTDPEDVARLAPLGITASIQPIHQDPAFLAGYMDKLNNDERCGRMFAYRDMVEKGAHLAIGTDTPTAEHNPLLNLYSAVVRKSVFDPSRKEAFHPEWALPLATCFVAASYGAAYSVKNENQFGSLRLVKVQISQFWISIHSKQE
ncbi:hypothetical protein L7F22_003278 [Adiantum nelumboides]|nr:hypothetical protein [Adiantum nelumboides]